MLRDFDCDVKLLCRWLIDCITHCLSPRKLFEMKLSFVPNEKNDIRKCWARMLLDGRSTYDVMRCVPRSCCSGFSMFTSHPDQPLNVYPTREAT